MKDNEYSFSIKLWRFMRICITQVAIAIFICGVSMASNAYSQLLDKELTLSVTDIPLQQALSEIANATGVKFAYSIEQLDVRENVSVQANKTSLRKVLDNLLSPYHIVYKIRDNDFTILLKRVDAGGRARSSQGTQRSLRDDSHRQQLNGVVFDILHQPMAGVNVVVKGTTNGTTTDSDGRFTIHALSGELLVFSFIGYAPEEVVVGTQTNLEIVMTEDAASLDEVVVNAGYYKTTKELQTGSIVRVESREIESQPVSNPLATLQSRVPGLEVTQQNGVPGSNFKVRIRGTNSLSSGNDPLYIIDGVPYTSSTMSFTETAGSLLGGSDGASGSSPLNNINPSDIESIEVLKDADATAIYGSRGANGVILITTKKGKAGATNVDVNFYAGMAQVSNKLDLLTTPEYIAMRKEGFRNDNVTPTDANARDLMEWDTTRYTNWQKELIGGTAHIQDARLSISGGAHNTQFLVGGGFHRESTVFPGNNHDQRLSLMSSITNTSPNEKFKTTFSLNVSRSNTNLLSKDLAFAALSLAPNAPALYTADGKLDWDGWTPSLENPLAFLQRKYESITTNLIANTTFSYDIIKNLQAKVNLGLTNVQSNAVTIVPMSSLHPAQPDQQNRSSFGESTFKNWIVEPQLNWNSNLGDGKLNVLAGATFLDQTSTRLAQFASGFTSEALMKNLGAAPLITSASNAYAQYRYEAFFGRVNYVWKERYVINLTGRRDGSSRFGPGQQFAQFGAVGGAWIFSREAFFNDALPFVSFGKLKASYGTTGNDQIGDYQYLNSYVSSSIYQGKKGLNPSRLYNPDFAWEINRKFEAGLELGFLNDAIAFQANYYRNRSSNQLVGFPLAPTTGFNTLQANFPAVVQNTGLEVLINSTNIRRGSDLEWTTSFNFSLPRNKLVDFPDIESSPGYASRYSVHEPLGSVKLFHYTGVNPETGLYEFEDFNGDGVLDLQDQKVVHFIGRKYYGGLANSIRIKGFQLDVLFQFVKQQGYNYTHLFFNAPGTAFNQPDLVLDRWMAPDDVSDVQRFTRGSSAASRAYSNNFYYSEGAVGDASFIRLKNLSLAYTFPQRMMQKITLQNFTIFIQCQNLLTMTKYKGLDPENPGSGALPPLRTMTAGFKLKI